ncbi:MAG: PAS domain S-box protein [Rhodospirillales bacterium]
MPTASKASRVAGLFDDKFAILRDEALAQLSGEDTLWALVEYIPDAVIVHSDNKIIYNNPAAAKLFGAKKEDDLLGVDPKSLTHSDEHKEISKKRGEAVQNIREGGTADRRHLRLDGTEFFFKKYVHQIWSG